MEDLQKASVIIACPGFGSLFWDESTQTFLGVPSSGPRSLGRTVSALYSRARQSTASPGSAGWFRNGHMTPNRQTAAWLAPSGSCSLSAEGLRGQDMSGASTRDGGPQRAEQRGGEVRAISKDISPAGDPGIP